MQEELRKLPSVDWLLTHEPLRSAAANLGHTVALEAARAALASARDRVTAGGRAPEPADLAIASARNARNDAHGTMLQVVNATGVILHTNLGRAPLSQASLQAISSVASGYSNLELDFEGGSRGSRQVHVESLLCRLTGAEAALVVNNNAAAVLLSLAALAAQREVIVSRGQLVEIGGGFRIPDVIRQSQARLVEVGTTNRTHLGDFRRAITDETALFLRIHSSNFRQIGFTAGVPLSEMVALAQTHGLAVVDDLGSGTLLDCSRFGLAPEPTVQDSVAAGAALVTFSGDKLLGGPQAGVIVGREESLVPLRDHPLARALRVDRCTLAGLQATLLHYLLGEAETEIPVWQMISLPIEKIAARAAGWVAELGGQGIPATVEPAVSTIGGGSLPGETLPSLALALHTPTPDALIRTLRRGDPPVVARIHGGLVLLDPRTVLPKQDATLVGAVALAWRGQ